MKQKKSSGQSLIEVMIALFVLVTGLLGILSLLAQSFYLSKVVSNETIGTYLAAEGVEIAKSLIDHDVYVRIAGGTGWAQGGADPCFPTSGDFEFDYTQITCPVPFYSPTDILYYDPTTHLYGYGNTGSGIASPFTRRIRVTPNGANEITVESIVSWSAGLATQSVDVEDHFYNWHP